MNVSGLRKYFRTVATAAMIAAIAACTTPAPVPTPPPVVERMPRPYPPMGAAPNLAIPPVSADGSRLTINSNLSLEQAVWNLRSAYNVAALNCTAPRHAEIRSSYGEFLKNHERALRDVNRTLDRKFRSQFGRSYIAEREVYQTQVYNYFALPPTIPTFCDAALAFGQDLRAVPPGNLMESAPAALAKFDGVFREFFDAYDRYRRDFVQWQINFTKRYGSPPSDGYFLPGEQRYQPQQQVQAATDPAQTVSGL